MTKTSNRFVAGIGVRGDTYLTIKDGKRLKEYYYWKHMLSRCIVGTGYKNKSYIGVTCSENFKHYSFFYEWCQEQIGFGNKDDNGKSWELDKDILAKGNKLYSEDTCCFVPRRVNNLFTKRDNHRGDYLIGVSLKRENGRFIAQMNKGGGKSEYLGIFDTQLEAFLCYKDAKENLIRSVADEYKAIICPKVYNALVKYEVEITD